MITADQIKRFYLNHIPDAEISGNYIKAPCPFCLKPEERKVTSAAVGKNDHANDGMADGAAPAGEKGTKADGKNEKSAKAPKPGLLFAYVNPDSHFCGYFQCSNRCTPGGFPLYFSRIMGIDPENAPGFDPDREPFVRGINFPALNLNTQLMNFRSYMHADRYEYFSKFGVSSSVVDEMKIGYNGRYFVYPYFQEDENCYAARCILPERETDFFWHGNETFSQPDFRIYNLPEIDRCEGGALFITDSENSMLALRELGYPGIAVSTTADLDVLTAKRLAHIENVFLVVKNTPEAQLAAHLLATRLGFKVRILKWPSGTKRDYDMTRMARDKKEKFREAVNQMIQKTKAFSPFASPEGEYRGFVEMIEREKGKALLGLRCGFEKMDHALSGICGINILGGPPKAGKSCFFMQISTEMARRRHPVIYYDFENGRQKIYSRTICRLSRLSEKEIRVDLKNPAANERLMTAHAEFKNMLVYLRVVTDRKLSPDIMRRQIDFIQHETRTDYSVVVVDSLHKLPFENLSDRRTGIDAWLRHMEAIRDEQNAAFLVVSELSRGEGGHYSDRPDIGSFKESGDIEYSADNAMIFMPDWNLLDPISTTQRKSALWLAASRENSPGKIAVYDLEYPYWGFKEL